MQVAELLVSGFRSTGSNAWRNIDGQRQGIGRARVADFEKEVGGIDVYPDVLSKLLSIKNVDGHPFEFYLKVGYHVVGLIPDANRYGKPDILMAKRIAPSTSTK